MAGTGEGRADLRHLIRTIPDHPRPGIAFRDITPLLGDAGAFDHACRAMAQPFVGAGVTHVLAIESRGFIFGGVIATLLGAGLVPARKQGKLPWKRVREEYLLEYGSDALEVHEDAFSVRARVLVVDDVLATGGTAAAAIRLSEGLGASVAGCSFLIELGFLSGRNLLGAAEARAVLNFEAP
ncbi:MAG: adenine phosphoribosyltransferase [Gemmatimonadota bacterium]